MMTAGYDDTHKICFLHHAGLDLACRCIHRTLAIEVDDHMIVYVIFFLNLMFCASIKNPSSATMEYMKKMNSQPVPST